MRILLVEDELDLGAAIKRVLLQERYIVDWAADGQTAWNYLDCGDFSYAIAVLDWLLPGISGLTILQQIRDRGLITPVLMLTARDRIADKIAGLDAGADDYLIKPFQMDELLARLRALQRRSPHLEPQVLRVGSLQLDCGTRTVTQQSDSPVPRTVELTTKEFQLLEYLMRHPNLVLSSEQIRNQLWEVGAETMSNVVAAQMRLLRRKLESFGVEVPIETVRGFGYRLKSSV